jgi:hypothetical protein
VFVPYLNVIIGIHTFWCGVPQLYCAYIRVDNDNTCQGMLKQESDPDSLPVRDKDNIIAWLEFSRMTQGSFRAKTQELIIKYAPYMA